MSSVRSLLDRLAAGEVALSDVERDFLDRSWLAEPRQDPVLEEPWLAVYRDIDSSPGDDVDRFSDVADAHLGGLLTVDQYTTLAKAAAASMRAQVLRTTQVLYVFEGGFKDGETENFRGVLDGTLYYDDRFGDAQSRYTATPRTVETPKGTALVLEYRGPHNW